MFKETNYLIESMDEYRFDKTDPVIIEEIFDNIYETLDENKKDQLKDTFTEFKNYLTLKKIAKTIETEINKQKPKPKPKPKKVVGGCKRSPKIFVE